MLWVIIQFDFYIAAEICFAISTILIIHFLGFRSRIDIEKTSIMNVVLLPIIRKKSLRNQILFSSLLFIVFDIEVLFLFPFTLNHHL